MDRDAFLARVSAAVAEVKDTPWSDPHTPGPLVPQPSDDDLVRRFAERLSAIDGVFHQVANQQQTLDVIVELAAAYGAESYLVVARKDTSEYRIHVTAEGQPTRFEIGVVGGFDPAGAKVPGPTEPLVLDIGAPAPEIVGVDVDGAAMRLSDYRGKVVLLDFWGFW